MSEKGMGKALPRAGVSAAHRGASVPCGVRNAAEALPGQGLCSHCQWHTG